MIFSNRCKNTQN